MQIIKKDEWTFRFQIPLENNASGAEAMQEPETIVQSLTDEQIKYVASKAGITEQSVIDLIADMNKNDFIALGLVDLTPDVVIGFSLCEQQYQDENI